MSLLEILSSCAFFLGLSEEEKKEIANLMEEKRFSAGETVFTKDDEARDLYILTEGECEVKVSLGGKLETYTIHRIKPIEVFGELSLVGIPRSATVKCAKDCKVYTLSCEKFNSLTKNNPHAGMIIYKNMAKILSERLRSTDEQLQNFYLSARVSFRHIF